jgi:NADPH2:quinone reductase
MKAVHFNEYNAPLELSEIAKPEPKPFEVLIRVAYAGINPVDYKIYEGLKTRLPSKLPIIPGWDVSGEIEAVGSEVENLKVGDAVMAFCRKPIIQNGTYAEYVTFFAEHVVKKPSNITFAQAATVPLVTLTAWQALFDAGHLHQGQKVLIQAGAGGVGGYAIQFAKYAGAQVVTTARKENHDYVKQLGADFAIDYTQGSVAERVKKWAPKGVDVAFEMIGGKSMEETLLSVKPGGYVATILEQVDPEAAAKAEVYYGYVFVRPCGMQLSKIAELIQINRIKVPEVQEFSLAQFNEALESQKSGRTGGKIVLRVRDIK